MDGKSVSFRSLCLPFPPDATYGMLFGVISTKGLVLDGECSVTCARSVRWRQNNLPDRLNTPETLDASETLVAFVPLLEPDISEATVPPSPIGFFADFRKPTVALTYVKKGT